MHRFALAAVATAAFALWLSACSTPLCPRNQIQHGTVCSHCPEGSAKKGNQCFTLDGGVLIDPVEVDDDAEAEDDADSGAMSEGDPLSDDASTAALDAGIGASMDAAASNSDAGPPREFALGSAGMPCPAGLEQSLACEGHASRKILKCQGGSWQVLQTCSTSERCDSRVGTEQGTCAGVPAACVGKSAGEICDGLVRLECGIDLVTVNERACGEHLHCESSPNTHCACDTGYQDDGQGGCSNPDDCPAGACSGGKCVDGLSDYSCNCNSGFAGTGTKKCSAVLYCPKDACTPGGTCVDTMNWSCQCNSGYTGTGTQACANQNDCPSTRCLAPNGTCQDQVGTYKCNCNPGFSGTDCVNDICAPGTCKNGGTCARTGALCTCAAGYSGTNCQQDLCNPNPCLNGGVCSRAGARCACAAGFTGSACETDGCSPNPCQHGGVCTRVAAGSGASCGCTGTGYNGGSCESDVNECANGAVAACGTGATGCTNLDGSYRCSCAAGYGLNRDQRGCHLRAWGTALTIDRGTGNAAGPALTVDGSGIVTAVWAQSDGTSTDVRFSRYENGNWSATTPAVDTSTLNASAAKVAANVSGTVVAVWLQSDGTSASVWCSRSSAGGTWSTPALLETNAGTAYEPKVALDPSGSATVVWYQTGGDGLDAVWTNRGLASGTWTGARLLGSNNVGGAHSPQVAVDRNGNALAVWYESDETRENVLAARYTLSAGWTAPIRISNGVAAATYPRIAIDDAGNAIAAWRQQEMRNVGRNNVWANRFVASASAWTGSLAIDNETAGTGAINLSVATDDLGNGTVAWDADDGSNTNIWSNRYSVGGTWTRAMLVENSGGQAFNPVLSIDGTGSTFVVWWAGTDIFTPDAWVNRATASGAWTGPTLLETLGDRANDPVVVADSAGNATAAWTQWDGTRYRIWARRYE